jgi:hypothetical protein
MFTINTLRNISAQTAYQYLIFTLVTYFLCIQAWDQSPTTNAAIATWIIGLVAWVIKKETGLTADQKKVIGISCSVFIFSLASWLLSDFDLNIKKIEPDIRFLLFGLTVIAVSYSQLTINQLSAALIIAGISNGGSAL